jgi:hypothetical protein
MVSTFPLMLRVALDEVALAYNELSVIMADAD